MAQGRKGKLNYRCPRCLMREIDMDMLYDEDRDEYYCLRCSFTGNEDEVKRLNQQTPLAHPSTLARAAQGRRVAQGTGIIDSVAFRSGGWMQENTN